MDNAPNYLVGWVRYPKEIGPVAPPLHWKINSLKSENSFTHIFKKIYFDAHCVKITT